MHELSLVADLVEECERRAAGRPVASVRVRHAATLAGEGLRQAFALLTAEGPLVDAALATEVTAVRLRCACGGETALSPDDLIGHLAVCPRCGEVSSPEPTPELELLEVRVRVPERRELRCASPT